MFAGFVAQNTRTYRNRITRERAKTRDYHLGLGSSPRMAQRKPQRSCQPISWKRLCRDILRISAEARAFYANEFVSMIEKASAEDGPWVSGLIDASRVLR